jgi:hypothetical protein
MGEAKQTPRSSGSFRKSFILWFQGIAVALIACAIGFGIALRRHQVEEDTRTLHARMIEKYEAEAAKENSLSAHLGLIIFEFATSWLITL